MSAPSVTLDELLASRDARAGKQRDLLAAHPNGTLVCLTVIMPGAVKRNDTSLSIARKAVKECERAFRSHIIACESRDLDTGFEAYFVLDLPAREAKRCCAAIEDSHPLGRLFDLDVILPGGRPLSRTELSLPERRCLLCDQPARHCMRNRTHTTEELTAHIRTMVENYLFI